MSWRCRPSPIVWGDSPGERVRGNLFTSDFLERGIRDTSAYRGLDTAVFAERAGKLRSLFADFPVTTSPNESETEARLIYPIADLIGWTNRQVQQSLEAGRRNVPDALLFLSEEDRRAADHEATQEGRVRHADAILEAKRWNVPFDSRVDRETPPMAQLLVYLSRAEVRSNRRVRWGILTDGRKWRLSFQGAPSLLTDYLEIDLAVLLDVAGVDPDLFSPPHEDREHWLKVFLLMFRADAFRRDGDGRTFHELALDQGRFWEARVKRSLSDTIFETVFPGLLRAFKAVDPNAPEVPDAAYLEELRDGAFTFLYRLLFTLYAEDRDLLPKADPHYDDYGLSLRVRDDIARRLDKPDTLSKKRPDYYDFCLKVFETIDEGDESVGVPPFNGGLFARERSPLLYRARIPDRAFAPLLDALSRTEQDGRQVRINYRDLSVRELGAVYERLLEREAIADDTAPAGIAIRLNPFARKGSGSYYTPDELVNLIIRRTVGPLVEERIDAFLEEATAPKVDLRLARELDPAGAILNLRLCDPAMGSGHFLVALVDFLADRVFEAVDIAQQALGEDYQSPILEAAERIRGRILQLSEERGWRVRNDMVDDKTIVRRMVLKRCIHGVDKNPMAVELAKVALWLHTLTAGAPLSFLDHHLRCGDSLFGERVRPVLDAIHVKGALLINAAVKRAEGASRGMAMIEQLTDADIAEAEESRGAFEEAEAMTMPLKRFLDFWHALKWLDLTSDDRRALDALFDGAFGDPIQVGGLMKLPEPPDDEALDLFERYGAEQASLLPDRATVRTYITLRALLERAHALAQEERFLHWELAFPRVWSDWMSAEPEGGFNAVIGNPPWDRMKMQEVEWFAARRPDIARQARAADRKRMIEALKKRVDPLAVEYERARHRAETAARLATRCGAYPLLGRGDVNIYSLFVERAQQLVSREGIAGLLVPSGIASDFTASTYFRSVSTSGRILALLDFENRRGRDRDGDRRPEFFPDVDTRFKFCAFVVGGPGRTGSTAECGFFLADPPAPGNPAVFALTPEDFTAVNPNTGTAPIFRSQRDAELTRTIYARLPVLVDRSGEKPLKPWPVQYFTMFHMTNESHLFWSRAALEAEGAYEVGMSRWRKGKRDWLPLYEGKMVQAFDHRAASVVIRPDNLNRPAQPETATGEQHADPAWTPQPQFWVKSPPFQLAKRFAWGIGFKDVTAPTNERSMIAAAVPVSGIGNTLPALCPSLPPFQNHSCRGGWLKATKKAISDYADWAPLLLGNLNSLPFDFVARQKIQGQHLNWFIVEQLPIVPPKGYDRRFGARRARAIVTDHVLRLTYTAHDMAPFARDMGYVDATGEVRPPFVWDEAERRHLRARLDALYFHLYGVTDEDDVRYILSTFPIVERKDREAHGCYLTAELIVWYMRALAVSDLDTVADEATLIRAAKAREAQKPPAA